MLNVEVGPFTKYRHVYAKDGKYVHLTKTNDEPWCGVWINTEKRIYCISDSDAPVPPCPRCP